MLDLNNKIELINNYKKNLDYIKKWEYNLIKTLEIILLQYLSDKIFIVDYDYNIWKYEADVYIWDNLSDLFDSYEYDLRQKLTKKELLEIIKFLKENNLFETYDFLETFIDVKEKKESWLYFEEIVEELYDDLKNYIKWKYYDKEYWSEWLIIRDLDYDINQYLLPILWKDLCKKMFKNELIHKNNNIYNHVLEFINKWWFNKE